MWGSRAESLQGGRSLKVSVLKEDKPVAYREALSLWCDDQAFRKFFSRLLADTPFAAFRWETPPISRTSADRPFGFVLLDSPALERPADPSSFAGQLDAAKGGDVVTFSNLGGDAIMVVPCPVAPDSAYGHLAAFLRSAPDAQVHWLWQAVGAAMQQRLSSAPVWLSTAGLGVPWLHVRLDSRPKYYGYVPYREPT